MIIAGNGIRTFIFAIGKSQGELTLDRFKQGGPIQGFCLELQNFPGPDGKVSTIINNPCASSGKGFQPEGYYVNINPASFMWADSIAPDSELHKKVTERYLEAPKPEDKNAPDLQKIAALKQLVSNLTPEELELLRQAPPKA